MPPVFSKDAKAVLEAAQTDAKRYSADIVSSTHILWAIVAQGKNSGLTLLTGLPTDTAGIMAGAAGVVHRGKQPKDEISDRELQHSTQARQVLAAAETEAGGGEIDVTHLLLGLASVDGPANTILVGYGVTKFALETALAKKAG